MVVMMAGQDAIEELTQEDLGDLRECISNRWVFSDESRPERLPWHESLDWADFYDLEILQAWVTGEHVSSRHAPARDTNRHRCTQPAAIRYRPQGGGTECARGTMNQPKIREGHRASSELYRFNYVGGLLTR